MRSFLVRKLSAEELHEEWKHAQFDHPMIDFLSDKSEKHKVGRAGARDIHSCCDVFREKAILGFRV